MKSRSKNNAQFFKCPEYGIGEFPLPNDPPECQELYYGMIHAFRQHQNNKNECEVKLHSPAK